MDLILGDNNFTGNCAPRSFPVWALTRVETMDPSVGGTRPSASLGSLDARACAYACVYVRVDMCL